jgi:hypothetical protein
LSNPASPIIDLALACSHLAVDQWNAALNTPTDTITSAISINNQGRFPGLGDPNSFVVLYFRSTAEERRDPRAFVRSVKKERVRQFREQSDLELHRLLHRIVKTSGILPFSLKQGLGRFLLGARSWISSSMLIHYLGSVLTDFGQEWSPGELCGIRGADLECTEVYGFAYKILPPWTPIHIWLYTYCNRLNMVLGTWAWHFSGSEAEEFTNLIAKNLLEYPAAP